MRYRVIVAFTDLKDHNYHYATGDRYPRNGLMVSGSRLKELSSANNRMGKAVIEAIADPAPAPTPVKEKVEEKERSANSRKKRKKDAVRDLS